MPSVSSVTSSAAADAVTARTVDDSASRIPQKNLGQNDFLKLLAVQFQVQDPMKPMEDTAFIAQMAQFSSLEQSSGLAKDMKEMRNDQLRVTATSYLGHKVTLDSEDGLTTGEVSAVEMSGGQPKLVVGDKLFSLSAVLRVEPSLVTAPAPVTTPVTAPAPQPVVTGGA